MRLKILSLLGIFLFAGGLGYLLVSDAINKTIEREALGVAEIVASQATTARSVYASQIADKLRADGFGPSVNSDQRPGHVPIPAQFLKLVGQASSANSDKLYEYKPVSKWNLEANQGLTDDFLRWAWPQLEQQDQNEPKRPIDWKPVSRFETQDGRRVLRYLSADPASQVSCVACHNAYEETAEIMARRVTDGVAGGKQWRQHQLMGALSITIPLDKAEKIGGNQATRTTTLFFGILVTSFLAMFWFCWRMTRQEQSLQDAERQIASSEQEARTANELLDAKKGLEQAYGELSTYIQAIDQHAIVSVTDEHGKILQVNDKFVEVSGYSEKEVIGLDHRILNSATHDPEFMANLWATLKRGEIWRGVICNRNKTGELYWVDSTIMPMRQLAGSAARYISIRIDITERVKAEQKMIRMATHDALTDLANRSLLRDRIQKALESGRRKKTKAAVLFVDLDQFKSINDSLGHDIGDALLIDVAKRLNDCVRKEDTVARQGGDEFIVFMPQIEETRSAAVLADKLVRTLAAPFRIGPHDLYISSSIGIAIFPDDAQDVDALLKNSDIAMYQVKEAGRNHFLFFAPAMNQSAVERFALGTDLRRAIERNELLLNFQPIVGFASGEIEALEVLLRWQHPTHGLVPPLKFIPLAEASGLIVGIGDWVLRQACSQIKRWRAEGYVVPRLAINLSAVQIHHRDLVAQIIAILESTGVDAGCLEIEITEGSLMKNTDDVLNTLEQLGDLDFKIAIDDFGTGYSSLSYLKRLPIETLKIDRSFVMDIGDDPDDEAIVAAVIAVAKSLKLRVIAEGVETEGQLAFLRAQGCDQYQGFLFSRPRTADEVALLFKRR
jgi:diguanylate cyclase (GGDEF)-like protein/PAS domain S-box-containing protein